MPSKGEIDAVVCELTSKRSKAKYWALKHLREHEKRGPTEDEAKRKHQAWLVKRTPDELATSAKVRETVASGESVTSLIANFTAHMIDGKEI